jgi:hypothetical protein
LAAKWCTVMAISGNSPPISRHRCLIGRLYQNLAVTSNQPRKNKQRIAQRSSRACVLTIATCMVTHIVAPTLVPYKILSARHSGVRWAVPAGPFE